jgi:hypothetical protein
MYQISANLVTLDGDNSPSFLIAGKPGKKGKLLQHSTAQQQHHRFRQDVSPKFHFVK